MKRRILLENQILTDPMVKPENEVLEKALGKNYMKFIDCMRRVHTPPLWGVIKGMNPETNTLPKQPYPVRSATGLVDFLPGEPIKTVKAGFIKKQYFLLTYFFLGY